jgi:hypothetical protein
MATPTFIQNRKLGEEFWNQELKKYTGIQSGALQPQELPEFKSMYQSLMEAGNQQLQRLYKEASMRGIQGGALEQLMKQAQEQINKGALGWIQNMYQVANQRGGQAATGAQNWWLQRTNLLQQLDAQRKQSHDMKQLAWANFGMNALKQAGTAAAGAMAGGMGGAEAAGAGASGGGMPPPSSGSMTPYGSRGGFNMPMVDFNAMSNNQQFDYWNRK